MKAQFQKMKYIFDITSLSSRIVSSQKALSEFYAEMHALNSNIFLELLNKVQVS